MRAAERGLRTVLIVTGKGRRDGVGVLKSALPRWLNETPLPPFVLALSQARPEHGGTGALYVLLKRFALPCPIFGIHRNCSTCQFVAFFKGIQQ